MTFMNLLSNSTKNRIAGILTVTATDLRPTVFTSSEHRAASSEHLPPKLTDHSVRTTILPKHLDVAVQNEIWLRASRSRVKGKFQFIVLDVSLRNLVECNMVMLTRPAPST